MTAAALCPDTILAAARACIDTPFMHQGRVPGVGLDCIGLVIAVARRFYDLPEIEAYGRVPAQGRLQSGMDLHPLLRRVSGPEPGDILLMRFRHEPRHVAFFAGDTIIHSYAQVGRVVEHRLDARWASRIVRAYRFKDLCHE